MHPTATMPDLTVVDLDHGRNFDAELASRLGFPIDPVEILAERVSRFVAGGLVGWFEGEPVFCGDAIADPLTGLQATLAELDAPARGGGGLVDVSMAATAARYACLPSAVGDDGLCHPPRSPAAGPVLGADTDTVKRLARTRASTRC